MLRILLAVVVFAFVGFQHASAQEQMGPPWLSPSRCSKADEIAADKDLDRLIDWSAVYHAFKLYRQCDDGALAEGYSDAVARLFARNWQSLPRFVRLAHADPLFGRFAFWHLDTTVTMEDDYAIKANARDHCPVGLKSWCVSLRDAVEQSMRP